MKRLLLLIALCLSGLSAFAQDERVWEPVSNPYYNAFSHSEAIFHNGKLYQVSCSTSVVKIYLYDNPSGLWTQVANLSVGSVNSSQSFFINDQLYIVAGSSSGFDVLKFTPGTNTLVNLNSTITATFPVLYKAVADADKIYLTYADNFSAVKLQVLSLAGGNWTPYDLTALLNPSSVDLSTGSTGLYISNTDIYALVSGPELRIVKAPKSNPSAVGYYNVNGSNDGKVRIQGYADSGISFYMTGNTQTAPTLNVISGMYYTYQAPVADVDIDIIAASTPLEFTPTPNSVAVLDEVPASFVFSNINAPGTGNATSDIYMMAEDHSTGIIDTVGNALYTNGYSLGTNPFRAHLDDAGQHMGVTFKPNGANFYNVSVLNRKPFIGNNSEQTNTGLCVGHYNEIYPQFELYDADVEKVRIVSLTSLNANFTNLTAVPYHYDDTQNPSVTKFRIFGKANSPSPDRIIITYSDGWSTITDTLQSISITASAPNVSFTESPLKLCSNENMIELESFLNTTGEGTFKLNGQVLASSTINGITQSALTPSGTLNYTVNIEGCYVEAGVVFNFVNAGTATSVTTPASCGSTNGTAEITYTNGTSSNVTFEWSTGETTAQIIGLSPGAYYYAVTDEYGCNTTGFASVAATGITVTETINNITCSGDNDGSVSVAVTGVPNYSILWSTGHSTPAISGLAPGNYEVTVTSGDCHVTESYAVTAPAAINASFWIGQSDCGLQNGTAVGTYSGGTGTLTYNWIGQSQTTANLNGVGYGTYQVEVKDANSCADTFSVQINDLYAGIIKDSVIYADCDASNGAILVQLLPASGGNFPTVFEWSNDNLLLSNYNIPAGTYTITCSVPSPDFSQTCYSAKTMTVGTKAPLRQEICLVTVDMESSTNLVVWERVESNVSYYNIYRENAVAGNYMWIDSVDAELESIFNDVVASPVDRSWRYKIAAVNACGIEGPVSVAHKTVHLNSILDQGDGSYDIYWDDYEGLTGTEYDVWRFTDQNGWEALVPSVPFGTSFFNDTPPPGSTNLDYYVEMIPSFTCTAEKAQDFNSSRSNKDRAQFNPGQGTGDSHNTLDESYLNSIEVYPNPVSGKLFISQSAGEALTVEVSGVNGALLTASASNQLVQEVSMSTFASGVYFVKLKTAAAERTVKVIKQ